MLAKCSTTELQTQPPLLTLKKKWIYNMTQQYCCWVQVCFRKWSQIAKQHPFSKLITAQFIKTELWKHPRAHQLMSGWREHRGYVQSRMFFIKNKERIPVHDNMDDLWMVLRSEISQAQDKSRVASLLKCREFIQDTGGEGRMVITWGWGRRGRVGEKLINGHKLSVS